MTIKEITASLHEVFEGNPWFGKSLSTYLQEIEANMLNFSIEQTNSIGQILDHMILWREFVMDQLRDLETVEPDDLSSGESYIQSQDWYDKKYKSSDKNILFAKIRASQKTLISLLNDTSDAMLSKLVPGKTYTFEHMLQGIIQHDIYHLGQLFLLISAAKRANENAGKND